MNKIIKVLLSLAKLFGILLSKIYLTTKTLTVRITRKLKFSMAFRISFRYGITLFSNLILSSVVIIFAFSFFVLKNDFLILKDTGLTVTKELNSALNLPENVIQELINNNLKIDVLNRNYTSILKPNSDLPTKFIPTNKISIFYFISLKNQNWLLKYPIKYQISNEDIYLILYKNISDDILDIKYFAIITGVSQAFILLLSFFSNTKSNIKLLKPIRDISKTTQKISADNLSLRINIQGIQDELKDLAQTINKMMDRIEGSYLKQQQFVSDASHELRTPISVLQGYANLLNRWGKEDPKVLEESIMALQNEEKNMQELVEKLLFLARNDKNTLVLEHTFFNLTNLVEDTVKETKLISKKHLIKSHIQKNVMYKGDEHRIKQVVRIFIDNAIKFTPENGEISLSLIKEQQHIAVYIKDTGVGIPEQNLKYIFDRFYCSDSSRSGQQKSHGLGLAIAKVIVLSHKGKIKVRSLEGKGTEFQIIL